MSKRRTPLSDVPFETPCFPDGPEIDISPDVYYLKPVFYVDYDCEGCTINGVYYLVYDHYGNQVQLFGDAAAAFDKARKSEEIVLVWSH